MIGCDRLSTISYTTQLPTSIPIATDSSLEGLWLEYHVVFVHRKIIERSLIHIRLSLFV